MNKNIIKLAQESINNGKIDQKRVDLISKRLTRTELKDYIKVLKNLTTKNKVYITLPTQPSEKQKKEFSSLFNNKEIVYNIDASIFPGIRILQGDLQYEVSLRNSMQQLLVHLNG